MGIQLQNKGCTVLARCGLAALAVGFASACGAGDSGFMARTGEKGTFSSRQGVEPAAGPRGNPGVPDFAAPVVLIAPTNGGPRAHIEGAFGPSFSWPVIPIHMVLLPDRRVLAYGTDTAGRQGAGFHYTVWNPRLGGGSDAFLTLPNFTGTDIFCAAQSLLPDGRVVLIGGDENPGTPENFGNPDMNVFDPRTNLLKKSVSMAFKRWYPTLVVLPSGERVVMGGRINIVYDDGVVVERNVATTPEVFTPGSGWRPLGAATSDIAYGNSAESFYYPRAWLSRTGNIFILGHDGLTFHLDAKAQGTLVRLSAVAPPSAIHYPSAMFAPGKILAVRNDRQAVVVDINGIQPWVQVTEPVPTLRKWGNATVLADGQVWVNGGSNNVNQLASAHYRSELWNPGTGRWTPAALAKQARLYHSASVLLSDGSVLTGGGGAPGPLTQLNGEVYFPPYLFQRDGSGRFAPRPGIVAAPSSATVGGELVLTLGNGVIARRLTLVRSGSATHSFNPEQRFMALEFTQVGAELRARLPTNINEFPPGYYLVFVFNGQGVPSQARMLRVTAPA